MISFLTTWRLWLELGVAALLLTALGVQTISLDSEKAGRATDRAGFATERANAATAAQEQTAAFRATEQGWQIKLSKANDDADARITKSHADAAIADASAGRLQQRVTALIAEARAAAANPSAAASSPSAQDPIGMLADVLKRADDRARLLADVADERGIAGAACEASYDAVTTP